MPSTLLSHSHGGSIPSLITTAITNLETIQQAARYSINIQRAHLDDPLSTISALASSLIDSLQLIQDIPSLQTLRVGEQVHQIVDLASRLGASTLVIVADSMNRRPSTPCPSQEEHDPTPTIPTTPAAPGQKQAQKEAQTQQEITPGNYVHNHLQIMAGQLSESKNKLFELVQSVLVGVSGNPKDGFRADMKELRAVNERVGQTMEVEMRLWERLRLRLREERMEGEEEGEGDKGKGGTVTDVIELDDEDVEYLGLPRVSGGMVEQWRAAVGEETGITREKE